MRLHAIRLWLGRIAIAASLAASGCAFHPEPLENISGTASPPLPRILDQQQMLQARIMRLTQLATASSALPPRIDVLEAAAGPDARPVPVVHMVFPDQVFFDFDSAALRPEADSVCDSIADAMRRDAAGTQLTVIGHTDAVGSDVYNLDLSRRRALSVLRALVLRGVDPGALSTVAVGKRQPIAPDSTEAGRATNRRVEFLVSPSLPANLSLIAQRPVEIALLTARPPESNAVEVLRPARDAADGVTLASLGSISLNEPTAPSAADVPAVAAVPRAAPPLPTPAPRQSESPAATHPVATAPKPAPLLPAEPATPRALAPEYQARPLGEAPESY